MLGLLDTAQRNVDQKNQRIDMVLLREEEEPNGR